MIMYRVYRLNKYLHTCTYPGDALLIYDMYADLTGSYMYYDMYISLPPPSRTAPQEVHMRDGNMIVSIDQIITKLDVASEENVRLRNTLHANNQLLDQKLKQFEPIIAENQSEYYIRVFC